MTLVHLQAEVERLRALLEDNGIDPDYDPDAVLPLPGDLVKAAVSLIGEELAARNPFAALIQRGRK